jgi:hypothetical protein
MNYKPFMMVARATLLCLVMTLGQTPESRAANSIIGCSQSIPKASLAGVPADCDLYAGFWRAGWAYKASWAADDYAGLWESAFAYRDLKGATCIAQDMGSRSPFWKSCFTALAFGQEMSPAQLDLIRASDVPERHFMPFLLLFGIEELRQSGEKRVRELVSMVTTINSETGGRPQDGTVADKFTQAMKHLPSSQATGDDMDWSSRSRRLMAAGLAYRTCHYKTARELTDPLMRRYSGELLDSSSEMANLLFLAYFQEPIVKRHENILYTQLGIKVKIAPSELSGNPNVWWQQLLALSCEREAIEHLKPSTRQ